MTHYSWIGIKNFVVTLCITLQFFNPLYDDMYEGVWSFVLVFGKSFDGFVFVYGFLFYWFFRYEWFPS